MKVQSELLAYKKDGHTLWHPSAGYSQQASVELDDYVEVAMIEGPLPPSDEAFPKGAPLISHVRVGNRLFKRKPG